MSNDFFNYTLSSETIVFEDTLKKGKPYIALTPRKHESVFFVTNGTLLYEKGDIKQTVSRGEVGYVARGGQDVSSAFECESVSYITVSFNFDRVNLYPQKTLDFATLCSSGIVYDYEKLFFGALKAFNSKTPGSITVTNGFVMQILGYLYDEQNIDVEKFAKEQKIKKSMEYLKLHYDEPDFRIGCLPSVSNLSEKQFRRIFLDVYEKNPCVFLRELRIKKGEILLTNTTKSISEIAEQCGFSDIYSFSHCFKNHYGISPEGFRKNIQSN